MILKGQSDRYGRLAAGLHWMSALAIAATIPLGFIAAHTRDPVQAIVLLRLHLPLGLAIILLTLARLVWWLFDRHPEALPDQPRWRAWLARSNHTLLYLVVLSLCGSGIGTVALSHVAPTIFGNGPVHLPNFAAVPPMVVHVASAFALVGLLIVHLAAVLYHQVGRRDHILARMRIN